MKKLFFFFILEDETHLAHILSFEINLNIIMIHEYRVSKRAENAQHAAGVRKLNSEKVSKSGSY